VYCRGHPRSRYLCGPLVLLGLGTQAPTAHPLLRHLHGVRKVVVVLQQQQAQTVSLVSLVCMRVTQLGMLAAAVRASAAAARRAWW
jgi:hypothetical protein